MDNPPSNWVNMKSFLDSLEDLKCQMLLIPKKSKDISTAFTHLVEHVIRLNIRRERIWDIENQMLSFHFEESPKKPFTQLQIEFIDALESFFQGTYAALGALAHLVNLIAPHEYKRGLSVASIKTFLINLSERHPYLGSEITKLEKARFFRSRFVDHTQQHKLYGWMTYSLYPCDEAEYYVIYFYGSGDYKQQMQWSEHPYDEHFVPPIDCDHFYVSPLYRGTFRSFEKVTLSILLELVVIV